MRDFERLRTLLDQDETLASELFAFQDIASFTAAAIRLAERFGLTISETDVNESLALGRSAWYATWAP